jgi:hypothetical protein
LDKFRWSLFGSSFGSHVDVHMRDSRAPMIVDGTDDPLGLHRPGWRIAIGGSERDARRATVNATRLKKAYRNIWIGSLTHEGQTSLRDARAPPLTSMLPGDGTDCLSVFLTLKANFCAPVPARFIASRRTSRIAGGVSTSTARAAAAASEHA